MTTVDSANEGLGSLTVLYLLKQVKVFFWLEASSSLTPEILLP